MANKMFVAVVGCVHGKLDKVYETVARIKASRGIKVSLVICCGDFQGVRNTTDLQCMKPSREERLNKTPNLYDFYRYYIGEKIAPVTTIFIGGNHEASNFLQELPYGGWVAPNIYYLGYAGVVNFGGLRIAGISGIYKEFDYAKGRTECPPYSQTDLTSVFHYRILEIFRLLQINTPIDVMLSHDWPKNIHDYGDRDKLYNENKNFRDDMDGNDLGSGPLMDVLHALKPPNWLAGHMHVKFPALVNHDAQNQSTSFLGLGKANDEDDGFLEIMEFPINQELSDLKLCFDPEWLAVLKSTDHLQSTELGVNPNFTAGDKPVHKDGKYFISTEDEVEAIRTLFNGNLEILQLQAFETTAPYYGPGKQLGPINHPIMIVNPQTTNFIEKLGLTDPVRIHSSVALQISSQVELERPAKKRKKEL